MMRRSQKEVLRAVLAASLILSVGGIAYAVFFGTAADGGRGGAVSVAISFAALFAARSTPQDVLEITDPRTGQPRIEGGSLEQRIRVLKTAIATMLDSQRLEKAYLTWSSMVGTLVWGFGDLIALWLGAPP